MSVTVIKDLAKAATERRDVVTIDSLANGEGRYYRHPDSVEISYPLVVGTRIGQLQRIVGEVNIAIIGAGPAGIASLYELRRALPDLGTMPQPGYKLNVTLFETDSQNFLFASNSNRRRAGRVSSQRVPNAVYEIGAMRFPSIAGLTWHYARAAFGGAHVVNPFPNPGTIPTEFVFGSQTDRYLGDNWQNMNSPTRMVRNLVLEGLAGIGGPSLYLIGNRSAAAVIPLLKSANTPASELQQIGRDWAAFVKDHDGTTLEAAVRHILTKLGGRLPSVSGLTGQQLINWCVELFGRFGFGTGGFKPLFNISLVEMMRLILWDYSNEYTFPSSLAPTNVDFIEALYRQANSGGSIFNVQVVQARVSDVFHQDNPRRAGVAYYRPNTSSVEFSTFDYAIIAMPHDAAAQITSRLGYGTTAGSGVLIGDSGTARNPGFAVRPSLLLSTTTGQDAVNARPVTAIGMLHMTRSSKIFATITEANATGAPVPHFPMQGSPISAVISDSGLAATYMVPSTTNPGSYRSFLVSYTWDDDSTRLQHSFANWPESAEPPRNGEMFGAMINRAYRTDPHAPGSKWWLGQLLTKVIQTDRVSFDWSTYLTAGGFKLDSTGDHHQSSLCFRYHTHALYPALNSRFFLAGCSFSHLGGWLEGAFMTAANAVAGIILLDNNGNLESLNSEARKLFTTLTPIIPMN
ncbi:flavin monoamine oxidase family protein [Paraburkholderia ginsengisoli]|uniref:Tryptophan 2-monooxygenase oxidoreductase n=1 Tax=Paraburkholderia ginsengisoli TaxID=311231 RepID=A0A7T4N359_9BURK|nr:hypothetical protein [Paraburkholderia ginsengisoli]QQC64390.1 tryptophan 2-monooxygenase oxidoreductase [Paraburkholderia ginsengisoli]